MAARLARNCSEGPESALRITLDYINSIIGYLGQPKQPSQLLKKTLLNFPAKGGNPQLKSLAIIMGINLMYGFAVPGIDNAGHIGGALTGAVLAVGIMLGYRYSTHSKKLSFKALPWLIFAIIALIFYKLWLDLHLQIGL